MEYVSQFFSQSSPSSSIHLSHSNVCLTSSVSIQPCLPAARFRRLSICTLYSIVQTYKPVYYLSTTCLLVCYLSATCLLPVCYLSATCLLPASYLSATCQLPVCYLPATCLPEMISSVDSSLTLRISWRSSHRHSNHETHVGSNMKSATNVRFQAHYICWCCSAICVTISQHL